MHPVSINFSREQVEWLDGQAAPAQLTRSGVVRMLVSEAMKRDARNRRLKAKAAAAQ